MQIILHLLYYLLGFENLFMALDYSCLRFVFKLEFFSLVVLLPLPLFFSHYKCQKYEMICNAKIYTISKSWQISFTSRMQAFHPTMNKSSQLTWCWSSMKKWHILFMFNDNITNVSTILTLSSLQSSIRFVKSVGILFLREWRCRILKY